MHVRWDGDARLRKAFNMLAELLDERGTIPGPEVEALFEVYA